MDRLKDLQSARKATATVGVISLVLMLATISYTIYNCLNH